MVIARLFLTIYICLLTYIQCQIQSLWSSEHLNDFIMSDQHRDSIPAITPAIIALYETQCAARLYHQYGFTDQGLPDPTLLLITQFDRTRASSETWYDFDDTMDLFNRYNISTNINNQNEWCPTILYQPAKWSDDVVIYNPNDGITYTQWVWKMMQRYVTFVNNLSTQTVVYLSKLVKNANDINNLYNEIIIATINPSESVSVLLHVSNQINILNDNHQVMNRLIINAVDDIINIDDDTKTDDINILNPDKYQESIEKAISFRKQRQWMCRRRLLFNTLIPPLIPKFTELGFEHHKMPKEICTYLTNFYDTNSHLFRVENFPADNPLINADEVPLHMLHIPHDKKLWIASILQPLLEEWTHQKLQFSILYGLREYSNGAVLKGHCDKLATHVVSAILHLRHDPLNISWPIEVYGFDKKRHYLEDAPCTMTFYESSTLIHGRPSTYHGNKWVNAFIHFRPETWEYSSTRDNFVITPQAKIPLVDPNKYG